MSAGEIDGELQRLATLVDEGFGHCRLQDPSLDGQNQPGLLRDRDEIRGSNEAHAGMLPAHQRLETIDPSGLEVDERLEMQQQLTAVERAAKVAGERQLG